MSRRYTAEECVEHFTDSPDPKAGFWLFILLVLIAGLALGVFVVPAEILPSDPSEPEIEINCPVCTDSFAELQTEVQLLVDKTNTEIGSEATMIVIHPALFVTYREPTSAVCWDAITIDVDGELVYYPITEMYPC